MRTVAEGQFLLRFSGCARRRQRQWYVLAGFAGYYAPRAVFLRLSQGASGFFKTRLQEDAAVFHVGSTVENTRMRLSTESHTFST